MLKTVLSPLFPFPSSFSSLLSPFFLSLLLPFSIPPSFSLFTLYRYSWGYRGPTITVLNPLCLNTAAIFLQNFVFWCRKVERDSSGQLLFPPARPGSGGLSAACRFPRHGRAVGSVPVSPALGWLCQRSTGSDSAGISAEVR